MNNVYLKGEQEGSGENNVSFQGEQEGSGENIPSVSNVSLKGVQEDSGENNSHGDDDVKVFQLNQNITLDKIVSPNSIFSTVALNEKSGSSDGLVNESHSVNETLSHSFSPPNEISSPASSQSVVLQDVTSVTENSRSHRRDKALQLDESVTLLANSIQSIESSHEKISSNSDLLNENKSVTESTPLYWKPSTEALPYTRPVDVTTLRNNESQDNGGISHEHTKLCHNYDGMLTLFKLYFKLTSKI